MRRLVLVVEVDADPTTTDPHDVGEMLVDGYEADRRHSYGNDDRPGAATFVSAEWEA